MGRPRKDKDLTIKSKTLFDHINQIRNVKNVNYFETLTESDKKTFNHYMICRFLSMDQNCIEEVAYLCKVFDKMDSPTFYKLSCALIPSTKFTPYIKSKNVKFDKQLLEFVSRKFEISTTTAAEYCYVYTSIPNGIEELKKICSGFGMRDKDIDKILTTE